MHSIGSGVAVNTAEHEKRCTMKKVFLALALTLLTYGTVATSTAQARPWRWGGGYYYNPGYSYTVPYGYYAPPAYYYAPPAYYGPRVFVGWRGWR